MRFSLTPFLVLALLSVQLPAAAPQIANLSVRGLEVGGTTRVIVTGSNLLPNPRLVLPFPVRHQKLLPQATANRITLDIQLDKKSPVGFSQLRIANDNGISNPVPVGVDGLREIPLTNQLKHLPVAMTGNLTGNTILRVAFAGKKGTNLVAEVEAKRLGSKLNPVVRILDERGRQLEFGGPQSRLSGDARATVKLPADGNYVVTLHDRLYRGAAPGIFRLKIGAFKYADMVFPLVVKEGGRRTLQFVATNLVGKERSVLVNSQAASDDQVGVRLPTSASGANPVLRVSHAHVLVEAAKNKAAVTTLPVSICGRIANSREEDRYRLAVKPGQRLRIDVLAQRVGSPLDGVLTVRIPNGRALATNDDQGNTSDPALNYNVPKGIKNVDVCITDLRGGHGRDFVYQINVSDLGQPDFELSLMADRINVPAGGHQFVRVQASRRNFNGEIQLGVQGLPPGVKVQGGKIRPGQTLGLLSILAPQGRPIHGLAKVVGVAKIGAARVERTARINANSATRSLPYLRSHTGLSITVPAPLSVAWSGSTQMTRGTQLDRQVRVVRRKGIQGRVRLRLLTNQTTPRRTVRRGNKNVQVNDTERTLRLRAQTIIMPNKSTGNVSLAVPTDMPASPWSVVLLADLLAADNKTVVATAVTPVISLQSRDPYSLLDSGPTSFTAIAGEGKSDTIQGKIKRAAGFKGNVKITLTGLPKGVAAPQTNIPAGKNDFALALKLKAGTKPQQLKNVSLVAIYTPNAKRGDLSVQKVRAKKLTIKIVAGKKKAVPKKKKPAKKK